MKPAPFNARYVAASNGIDRFQSKIQKSEPGFFTLIVVYSFAIFGLIKFVTDLAIPFYTHAVSVGVREMMGW